MLVNVSQNLLCVNPVILTMDIQLQGLPVEVLRYRSFGAICRAGVTGRDKAPDLGPQHLAGLLHVKLQQVCSMFSGHD